ncbi:MAG: hypothetical protein HC822_00235 [Oscillochloris sp.]|nr:hypothetical protein [Oscillochloris sp.]
MPVGLFSFVRDEVVALRRPILWIGLSLVLVVMIISPQLSRRLVIDVGYEEGIGSDLPFLQGFNTAERDANGTFRWTAAESLIVVPGFGRRPALVSLYFFPFGPQVAARGPQTIDVYADDRLIATLPIRAEGSIQQIVMPPAADGIVRLTLRSTTFSLPNDERQLGTLLDQVRIQSVPGSPPALPDIHALGGWLLTLVIGWLAVRHALTGVAVAQWPAASVVFMLGGLLVAAAIFLDPARWAFGTNAALTAVLLTYPLIIAVGYGLPRVAKHLGVPFDRFTMAWLTLFIGISFALRYGGRLYPDSMHGDIGFHHNRFNETVWGLLHILSVNRGVEFPYPTAPYIGIAPLTLLGVHPRHALQIGAALVDALSAALIYAIATRLLFPRPALLAAGIYVFTAATFMVSWWSFDTHIYTQFFHLLLIAVLIWAGDAWQADNRRQRLFWIGMVAGALTLVFLGHFGFLINSALLLGGLTIVAWFLGRQPESWAYRVRWPLTIAVVIAGAFAGITFYSAYIPVFLSQLQAASAGGLTAVAGRGPVSRAVMWQTLWQAGLLTHFGLFPLLLALGGVWQLVRGVGTANNRSSASRHTAIWLMGGSLLVAVAFAVLPFITGLTNSPRWMLFIAWVVAIGSAAAATQIWRMSRSGKLAVLIMGAVVVLNTAWIWLAPMLWRIRPPEPF